MVVVSLQYKKLPSDNKEIKTHILRDSLPVALQELSYLVATWGTTLILAKYASIGDVGIWTAAQQWNAIVIFIPGLLLNVVLSYLSGSIDINHHVNMLKKMLVINFLCALVPFVVVACFSSFIVSLYGNTFVGMHSVLVVLLLSSVFMCLSNVLLSDFISLGRNWELLFARFVRDAILLLALYFVVTKNSENAAFNFAIIHVVAYIVFFLVLSLLLKNVYRGGRNDLQKVDSNNQ